MTRAANLTRAVAQRRSASISLLRQSIHLDLSRAQDSSCDTFTSTSALTLVTSEPSVEIDLVAAGQPHVEVDGTQVSATYTDSLVRVEGLTPGVEHTIVVRAECLYSHTGEGLHRYLDPEDGQTYLYTHFEPTDARRVFACFDQPDLKTSFEVSVAAPSHWLVRANGACESATALPSEAGVERTLHTFAPTQVQATYIICIAAGPYAIVQDRLTFDDGRTVDLAVLCRPAMRAHLPSDDMFRWTKAGLPWCEEKFGYPFPWGKYDSIFVPEYNIGAMENPGLVTFNEHYLKRGEATASEREGLATVVLHEMAHMWFGDLVTMPWWDDLWLKESFADFIGTQAASEVTEFADAWLTFNLRRKAWAYAADQLPTTHPIVADIPDVEAARANFDGITYAKGASVLRQLVAYVGPDAFYAGARAYFAKHAFGNAQLDDLLVELSAASGRDMSAWAHAWLETTGPDTITLARPADAPIELHRTSVDAVTGELTNRPHRLSVTSFAVSDQGWAPTAEQQLDVDTDAVPVEVTDGPTLVDDGGWTYAKIRPDAMTVQALHEHLSTLAEPRRRALAWAQLWQLTRDAELPALDFLAMANRHLPNESTPAIVDAVVAHASAALSDYAPPADRAEAGNRLWRTATQAYERAVSRDQSSVGEGRDIALAWRKALITAAAHAPEASSSVRGLLTGEVGLIRPDDDERWALLTSYVAHGNQAADLIAAQERRDTTKRGQAKAIQVAAAHRGEGTKRQAWGRTSEASLTNEEVAALVSGLTHPASVHDAAGLADAYFSALESWWRTRSQVIATQLARGLFAIVTDPDQAALWLHAHPDAPGALRRIVIEELDGLKRSLRAQQLDEK